MSHIAPNPRALAKQQKKERRRKLLAKFHLLWKEARPDLRHSSTELREERLEFAKAELGLASLGSFSELTDRHLVKLLQALTRQRRQPGLPGCDRHHVQAEPSAEVFHLASAEQCWAIDRIFRYLGWSQDFQEKFIHDRYRRKSARLLTPKSASALFRILLNVAAARDLKAERGQEAKITQAMIRAYIPALKAQLFIDQHKELADAADGNSGRK